MAQQLNQRTVPVGGDEPKRAWFDEYARSDRGILEFATLAAANTWAADAANAEYAVDGRHAWITGENAVYVRSSGAWEVLWRAAENTGWIAVATGSGFSGDPAYRLIGGVCHLRGTITRTAGSWPAGQTDTITLPAVATPTRLTRGAPTFYNTNPPTGIAVDVATSGLITVRAGGAAASASVYLGGINYPVA